MHISTHTYTQSDNMDFATVLLSEAGLVTESKQNQDHTKKGV